MRTEPKSTTWHIRRQLKVAEVPPGPPVYQTLVAEVYGPEMKGQIDVARQIPSEIFQKPQVSWISIGCGRRTEELTFHVDKEKAALQGVGAADFKHAAPGLAGAEVGTRSPPQRREDVPIDLELPRTGRTSVTNWKKSEVASMLGSPGAAR